MKWLPGPHQEIFTELKKIVHFVELKVVEHRKNFDPSSPRDYIDSFLSEMGEVSNLMSVSFLLLLLFWLKITDTTNVWCVMIEGGWRFWFWYEEFVCLHSGPLWCWNWNYYHNFVLGNAIHDLLPWDTRCVCMQEWYRSHSFLGVFWSCQGCLTHQSCLRHDDMCPSSQICITLTHIAPFVFVCRESPGWDRLCCRLIQSSFNEWQRWHALY